MKTPGPKLVKPRRRTGEKPERRQPLKVDLLPEKLRDRILSERNQLGRTWQEIEIASPEWQEWKLATPEAEAAFPGRKLPHTTLHRWYDLRVEQVRADAMAQNVVAREVASSFAKAVVKGDQQAVVNAARDIIFSLLENGDEAHRAVTAKKLIDLGYLMQMARGNEIKARKLNLDERRVVVAEKRLEQLKGQVKGLKDELGKKQMSPAELQQKLDEIYGL